MKEVRETSRSMRTSSRERVRTRFLHVIQPLFPHVPLTAYLFSRRSYLRHTKYLGGPHSASFEIYPKEICTQTTGSWRLSRLSHGNISLNLSATIILITTISIMSLPSGKTTSSFWRLVISPLQLDGSAGSKVAIRTRSVFGEEAEEGEGEMEDLSFWKEVVGEMEGEET